MTQREKRRLMVLGVLVIVAIVGVAIMYNNKDEFQADAKEAEYYEIIEAKIVTKEKLAELDRIYDILEEHYPFFGVNERVNDTYWFKNKRKHRRLIKNTKNDAEFLVAMEMILSELNDHNTQFLSGQDYKWLYKYNYKNMEKKNDLKNFPYYEALTSPFSMYRYTFDGNIEDIELYVEPNLETQILKEEDIAYIKIKTMAGFELLQKDYIEIGKFFKQVENYNKLIIDIRGNSGGEDEYWENIVGLLTDKPLEANYLSFFKDGHRFNQDPYKVEGARTIKELESDFLAKFPEKVESDFSYYKKYSIRLEPLDFESITLEEINFKGKVYLLVDRDVYAQSENFASFSKDTGFAKLVGEKTGGNRIFEEVPIVDLNKTRFAMSYSRELGVNSDGTINMEVKTIPDIEADAEITKDIKDDKAIEAVIED